jgi:hypothetical protein
LYFGAPWSVCEAFCENNVEQETRSKAANG